MSNVTNNNQKVNEAINTNKKVVLNVEDLILKDEAVNRELFNKSFADLTEEDLKSYLKFPAKVYQEEIRNGFGKAVEIKKIWTLAIMICPSVILKRSITDEELGLIQFLNPNLISNKAVVQVPTKLISSLREDGTRFFRVISYLCDSVYYGSSKKKNNNGFLSDKQVKLICINNIACKTEKALKPVKFVNVTKAETEQLDSLYGDDSFTFGEEF